MVAEKDAEVERLRGLLLFREEAEGIKERSKGDAAGEYVQVFSLLVWFGGLV
jgi:hypothetical protein